ncbi:PQ-loop-domain-containing protein [Xylaria bambusicola]|uniref:PQ-loop-domain-containing protein n=1 Tax=Xylaria bambusicola TaxID=326684 RepID=UPI002007B0EB|nr:PQ-loop-domain-containing protein [Xylaria bambusicola]KAI0505652.1 PQ-loop-domain-containing protein [Xylaria bambusicola]
MAPQGEIPVAANVLGTIGTVLWSIQLIPQAWTNWRTKSTEGLPASMMFLWALCGVPFGVYAIVQNFNIPIQVQPQAFGILCIINWGQILLYTYKWPLWKVLAITIGTTGAFGGVEAALVLTIRPIYKAGNETPVIIIGVIAAILLAAGLLPPYGEAWKRRGRIIGINFLFLSIDSSGAIFSLFSLVAQHTFDVLGGVMYIIVIVLELGIFASHFIWLFQTRKIRKQAKAEGKTFDDVMAEYEEQGVPFKFAERKGTWPWRKSKGDEEIAMGSDEKISNKSRDVNEAADKKDVSDEGARRSGQDSED